MNTKILISLVAFLVVGALGASAFALPPSQVRGLDIAAVVAMYDRARLTQMQLDPGHETHSFKTIRTIVIDPGHGGENQGAYGVAGIHEKYLTLELAYDLRAKLQADYPDVRVVMTRYWDQSVGLQDRIHYANRIDADLFVSLHYNAATHSRAAGFETYYLVTSEATPGKEEKQGAPIATAAPGVTGMQIDLDDRPIATTSNDVMTQMQRDLDRQRLHRDCGMLAATVNANLDAQLEAPNRGVKQANFAVLRGAQMPAIVVESGFVSNPAEGKKIVSDAHRGKIVRALTTAISRFDAQLATRESAK